MASALTQTVLQYIPTFEKVEPFNNQMTSSPALDGAGSEEPLQHSLVLTNVATQSATTEKMQKKLDYEVGKTKPKSSRRLLRNISKSIVRASSNTKEQPSSPKQQPRLRQSSRTISQHEINIKNNLKSSAALKQSSNLKGSVNLKKSSNVRPKKPTTLTMTIELSKPVEAEVPKSEPVSRTTSELKLSRTNSVRSPAASPRVPVANVLQSPVMSARGPMLRTSNNLKASNTLKSSAPRTQSPAAASPRTSALARKQSLVQIVEAPASPATSSRSPRASPRTAGLKMSSSLKYSSGVRSVPVGSSTEDTLKVLLHDFESQHRRALKIGAVEQQIYNQEISKFQEMMEKKKKEDESAVELAKDIQDREDRLVSLFKDLERKKRTYKGTEEELAAAMKEFEAELQQQPVQTPEEACSVAGGSTAAARLQEASNRKQLKEQWKKTAGGPVADTRHRLLRQQEEIRETEAKINVLKKELGRMKNTASKAKSSDSRLREEIVLRENMRKTGQPKERGQWVRPKGTTKSNEKPAAISRLEEEKAKRLARKRATVDVSDFITAQAGVSKTRYGSPHRNTVSGALKSGQF